MNDRVFRASNAQKLENPERLEWLPAAEILRELKLAPGMQISDIGAGTGYFSLPMALSVGDQGQVFAVDLQTEMLELLRAKLRVPDAPTNILLQAGDACTTNLASGSIDLVFFANVWHEFDDMECVLREAIRIGSDQGRIAILDWRPDCMPPPGPPSDYRISATAVEQFLAENGCVNPVRKNVGRYSFLVAADLPIG